MIGLVQVWSLDLITYNELMKEVVCRSGWKSAYTELLVRSLKHVSESRGTPKN